MSKNIYIKAPRGLYSSFANKFDLFTGLLTMEAAAGG